MNKLTFLITIMSVFAALPTPKKESPLACNLNGRTHQERTRHFVQLGPALRALKTGVRELPNGYEFSFPADAKTFAMLAEWIDQERRCCPFFDIDLRVEREGGPLSMRLTGRPGTKEFIELDAKPWLTK